MFGFKRTTKSVVTAAPAIDPSELAYSSAWGIKYSAWLALTPEQRTDYRDRVAYAPALQTAGK